MEEEFKAVQEVAKTAGKVTDAAREFGGFLAFLIKRPLEQAMAIWEDRLKYMRWERQVRLMQRAKKFLSDRGLQEASRATPMSFAIPLLQAASLEEDDYLQDRWAMLLVNAADAKSGIDIRRAFISILEDLSPFDALILDKIFHALPAATTAENQRIFTAQLPEEAVVWNDKEHPANTIRLPKEVELSLGNLYRLGCLTSWGGWFIPPNDFICVCLTALGKAFVEACTISHG